MSRRPQAFGFFIPTGLSVYLPSGMPSSRKTPAESVTANRSNPSAVTRTVTPASPAPFSSTLPSSTREAGFAGFPACFPQEKEMSDRVMKEQKRVSL